MSAILVSPGSLRERIRESSNYNYFSFANSYNAFKNCILWDYSVEL